MGKAYSGFSMPGGAMQGELSATYELIVDFKK